MGFAHQDSKQLEKALKWSLRLSLAESFQENLARIMREKGVNGNRLAEIMEMTRSAVSGYKTGKTVPALKMVERFARALDVDPIDLLKD